MESNVNDIETKGQTFRYRSLLSERKQTFLFGPLTIGTKAKNFDLVQKNFLLQADLFRFGPKILG
jgi:hypothetical protein